MIVLVGGGLAAQRCAETLRRDGYDGRLTIVCAEPHAPYDRPPLSKAVLAGDAGPQTTALRPAEWYADNGVDLVLGDPAVALDHRAVRLRSGRVLAYERALVATGADARRLPAAPHAHVLRTLDDAQRLRAALKPGTRLAVVGAGLVGLEAASTAIALGARVTVVEPAPLPLARALAPPLGAWLARLHREHGVDLRLNDGVGRVDSDVLHTTSGACIAYDALLVAIGVRPATGWLPPALPPHVYLAGDVTGHQHWEAAARQGAAAARAMLGLPAPPVPLSSWWSDQHGHRLQGLGDPAGCDDIIYEDEGEGGFTALCLCAGRPVAALAVDRPRALPALRRALTSTDLEEAA